MSVIAVGMKIASLEDLDIRGTRDVVSESESPKPLVLLKGFGIAHGLHKQHFC